MFLNQINMQTLLLVRYSALFSEGQNQSNGILMPKTSELEFRLRQSLAPAVI